MICTVGNNSAEYGTYLLLSIMKPLPKMLDHRCQLLETNKVKTLSLHDQRELNMR